jgi:peptidyl-prolyl cis-trans isomerase C
MKDDYQMPPMLMVAVVLFFILAYYTWFNESGGGREVSASHILVKDKAEAERFLVELEGVPDKRDVATLFAKFARSASTCPSGKSGGSLGTFGPGQMVPSFDKVCWEAEIGKPVGPVETQFGYHLILVTSRSADEKEN